MKPERFQSPYRVPFATGLSETELQRHLRNARYLRSLAFKRAFQGAVRAVTSALGALKTSLDRRRAIAELSSLDERTLKDIGIDRSEIPLIVEQLLAHRKADGDPKKVYPLRALTREPEPCLEASDDERCPPLAA